MSDYNFTTGRLLAISKAVTVKLLDDSEDSVAITDAQIEALFPTEHVQEGE